MKRISLVVSLAVLFIALSFRVDAQSTIQYYMGGNGAVAVLPGRAVRIEYEAWSSDSGKATVRLYRLPLAQRIKWLNSWHYYLSQDELKGMELVRTVVAAPRALDDGRYGVSVNFGAARNGEYLAVWDNGYYGSAEIIDVGSLGTVWHVAGKTLLVYAVDLATMRHRSDVRYSIVRKNGNRDGLVTFHGLAWLHSADLARATLLGTASDGSSTVQGMGTFEGASTQPGYIQTDRPIYRPGQHMYVRAILREGTIGAFVIPHGEVRMVVRGSDGTNLYDRKVRLTPFGTVSADVEIPQSAQLGTYEIRAGEISSSVSVQAYKKPEYLLNASAAGPYIVGGETARFSVDAKYFFGKPAAGMHVHYVVSANPYYFPYYNPYSFISSGREYGSENLADAEGSTDANGRLEISVPTKHADYEKSLSVLLEGRDASGRTVSTETSAELVPAAFRIGLVPNKWYAQLGDDVAVNVSTKDYDGHARARTAIRAQIRGMHWNYQTHAQTILPQETQSLQTDDTGKAVLRWHPQHSGSYEIEVTGKDERGNPASSSLYFWVSASNEAWWYPDENVTLIPDKQTYRPGERPKVLLTAPQADADAVVITSDDGIRSGRVVHIGPKPQTLLIDPPKDAALYRVSVEIPGKDGLSVGQTTIRVAPAPRTLTVTLSPDRRKYEPGQRATFSVHVKDVNGKPVRAELGIGVVDEALFAVQEENHAGALAEFYENQQTYMSAYASWYRLINGPVVAQPPHSPFLKEIGHVAASSASDVYSVNAATAQGLGGGRNLNGAYSALASMPPRSYFPDTAYWKPDVVTDAGGNASMSFDWPDTLTTWRATGVAVDMQTSLGGAKRDALVTKDFLVRLEMPRFLRRGDRSQFTGIVNAKSGRAASLRLDAGDLLRGSSPSQEIALDSNQTGNAMWLINPLSSLGERDITLSGSGGALTDAMRLAIPIEAAGAAEHLRDAGEVHDRNTLSFALPAMYDPGELRVSIAPSVVASLVQNVRLLDVYPYYCTEQTMSTALPAVFVDRMLKRTGIAGAGDSIESATVVKKAIARLAELQHADGSWGWWETDSAHPFMTAYALYGLSEFKKAGYTVPGAMIQRGVESLVQQLQVNNDDTLGLWGGRQPGSQWNTRAFMLYALSGAAPNRMDQKLLAQTMAHAPNLNDYALAVLGLAQHQLHNDAAAREILDRLNHREVDQGAYTFWLGQTWHYAWQDDPIETTAYALRLNVALDPGSPRVGHIVNFLRSEQRGNWWYTTKDTAAAVYAISETVPEGLSEFHPDEIVRVLVDGRVIDRLHVTSAVLSGKDASIVVPARDFEHGGEVRFDVSGTGSLYWSTDWTRYAPPYARKVADASESLLARLRAKPSSFSIERQYHAKRWPWQVGDQIEVEDTVRTDSDTDYVAIEDPFPAGAEYQPMQGQAAYDWSGLQFFDDRAVFFADHLYARYPITLHYTLRVTTPGTYTASPPTAYAMYGPPVSTVGQPDKVTVR